MSPETSISSKASNSNVSGLSEDKQDGFAKFDAFTGSKGILLLQFQPQMACAIILGIFISFTSCLMDVAYSLGKPPSTDHRYDIELLSSTYYIVYAFDVFYVLDVTSMVLYKRIKWSDSMKYTPRHTFTLIVEGISLIPIDMIYKIISTSPSALVIYLLRLRYALRLIRIFTFLTEAKKYIGEHSAVLHMIIYFGLMYLLLVTVSCASYLYECRIVNVTCTGENFREVMGTAMYYSGAVLSLVGSTAYLPNFTLVSNVGFVLMSYIINIYFIAFFTCDVMHSLRNQFIHLNIYTLYAFRISKWKKTLQQEWRSFHRKYELLVEEYGNLVWWKTKGQLPELYIGKVLPPIMYNEIFLDISWEPLKHTHLFRDEDVFFLRTVGSIMKYKFLSRGQIIYRRHKYKNAMIYIISGVVQVLSEEDCETPIMTLASGSVLGESSLFINSQSNSTTVSKGVCEVAILYRKDFLKVIPKLYPDKYKAMFEEIWRRYEDAKSYREVATYQFHIKSHWKENISALSTRWLNFTLKSFLSSKQQLGELGDKYYLLKLKNSSFCAKYLDLIVKADEYQLQSDSVFIKNTFPFIFKDHSVLLTVWNFVMLIIVFVLALTYPYFFVFSRQLSLSYSLFFVVVTAIWWLDLYICSSSVVVTKYEIYATISDIITQKLESYTYVLDILSAITPELLFYMVNGQLPLHVARFACANRLLKMYKIHTFFAQLRANSTAYIYLKYIKKCIDLLLCVYYIGTIIFLLSNRSEATGEIYKNFLKQYNIQHVIEEVVVCCFSVFEYYGNLAVWNFPYLSNRSSWPEWILIQVCLCVANLLFLATIISMETLNRLGTQKMDEYIYDIDVAMQSYHLNKRLKKRVWRYINMQYEVSDSYFLIAQRTRKNLPYDLFVMTSGIRLGYMIRNQPLFIEFSDYMIAHISTVATIHLLPATEVLRYAGEVCTELYILVEGTCEMKLPNGRSKSVEPGECFFVLETNLNIPSLVTIIASTNCKIITIGYRNLKSILLHYPIEFDILEDTARHFRDHTDTIMLQEMRGQIKHQNIFVKYQQRNIYCFGYGLKKRTKRFYKFHEGFPKWASPLKYILLRFCFYANGKYVFYWEISRCVFAFATNALFPLTCLSKKFTVMRIILIALDGLAAIDVYIRHHFSYFNRRGIEVTHPYKCAKHYWKYAFAVDLLGCLPINEVVAIIFDTDNHLFFYLNRMLQLYRPRALYRYIFRSNIRHRGVILMLEILICTLLVVNIITGYTFIYFCSIDASENVICDSRSWIGKVGGNKYEKYAKLIFLTISCFAFSGFQKIHSSSLMGTYYMIPVMVVGYIGYNVIVAKIAAHSLNINKDLVIYQEKLGFLVVYLNYKKVDKHIKQELIKHFEYTWYKTKAKNIHTSFEGFKSSFRVEALYNIYGTAFKDSKIFPPPNESFFKSLIMDTKHELYLKTGIIYSVNDVTGDIFLLLRGRIGVVGADGNKLSILHVGSVFGNLDNCPLGRRTLKMVAYGHVEVLRISSTVFHAHLSKFPVLKRFFDKLTIFHVDYIEEMRWALQVATDKTPKTIKARSVSTHLNLSKSKYNTQKMKVKVFFENTYWLWCWESIIINVVCFITFLFEIFHISTLEDSLAFTILLYSTDVCFIIKMYLKFNTSYEDAFGRVIKKRGLIALRYMHKTHVFFYDLATTLPFEVVALLFMNSDRFRLVWALGRVNRIFRVFMLMAYLKSMTQKLNINVFVVKSMFFLLNTIIAQITLGAFLTITIGGQCKSFTELGAMHRVHCFIYFLQAIINTCAKITFKIGDESFNKYQAIVGLIVILLSKAITVAFIAECCSILYVVTHTRKKFEQFKIFMKTWMYTENVSLPLAERLSTYLDLLWNFNGGHQYPVLLNEAPYYLKEAVLNSMFNLSLLNHPALQHCHKDLIRQITFHVKTLFFFPGDIVVYIGDIDNCMYFIQEGEIQALSEDTMSSEVVAKVLYAGEMFGFNQGLYERCGHEYTYKVTNFTTVTYLKRNSWIYLLDFFPASKYLIYKHAEENSIE